MGSDKSSIGLIGLLIIVAFSAGALLAWALRPKTKVTTITRDDAHYIVEIMEKDLR